MTLDEGQDIDRVYDQMKDDKILKDVKSCDLCCEPLTKEDKGYSDGVHKACVDRENAGYLGD